ncbi:NUDIX domain-containing protein, partial [Streptomyces sp. NPDC047042]|uniref:NUDIX domain-containing protein n=1 Tax=Streptomyces sp. NPDC047042 TaxID=3154807 RepID=UPI0033F9FEC8
MKVRHNVRAVLRDGGHRVFLRRRWPGGASYYTTVGGGVEAEDADLEAALSREVMEEIGATIGPATEFLTLTEPSEKVTVVQHFFRADVLDMDLNRRSGPELEDPDIGDFSPVRVTLDESAVRALELIHPNSRTTCWSTPRIGVPERLSALTECSRRGVIRSRNVPAGRSSVPGSALVM